MAYIGKSPTGSGVRQRYVYTATGGETSLSGTDDNGKTLIFTDGEYVDVYLNGVLLVQGSDYGVGTTNTISGLTALTAGQVVEIIVYDIYSVAKINSEAIRYRYYKTATGGETSISGADDSGVTITFPANAQIDVYLNGISLVAGTDYNTTTANTVGGLAALSSGDVVEIIYYTKFVLSDTVSKANGGTFSGNVNINGNLDINGNELILDADADTSITADTDDQIDIKIGGSDVASFTSNGLKMVSGKGIDFSATSDGSGTMSSELLDDYEEGTWTPTVNVGSVSPSRASYVKIGKMVTVQANLGDITNYSSTSDVTIGGLPYATSSSPENQSIGSCLVRFVSKTDALQLNPLSSVGGSTVFFYWSFNNNATWDGLRYADASAEWDMIFTVTYEAA